MPELPEVEVTRMGIAPYLTGARIASIRLGKALRWPLGCDVAFLVGQRIHGVQRRGKYLVLALDDGILLIHLGMSGRLNFAPELGLPGVHDHFDLLVSASGGIRLHDPRRFGAVVWAPAVDKGMGLKLLGHLGREPLGEDFDALAFALEIKQHKAAIKQVLLAGQVVVGVGNIYANEVLFLAKINPRRSACKIGVQRLKQLALAIQDTLRQAIGYGGSTLKDFRGAHGEHGFFQLHAQVYGRQGEPCVACGRAIKLVQQGQRSTYYCAHCQR